MHLCALFLALFTIVVEKQHHRFAQNGQRKQVDEEGAALSFLQLQQAAAALIIAVLAIINQKSVNRS